LKFRKELQFRSCPGNSPACFLTYCLWLCCRCEQRQLVFWSEYRRHACRLSY